MINSRLASLDGAAGSSEPINLIATNLIKCTFCGAFIPYN
jgi:hypothetical protein